MTFVRVQNYLFWQVWATIKTNIEVFWPKLAAILGLVLISLHLLFVFVPHRDPNSVYVNPTMDRESSTQ